MSENYKQSRNPLLYQSRLHVRELEEEIKSIKQESKQLVEELRWEIKTLKSKLATEEAAHTASKHDFHKRQLQWLGVMEETIQSRQHEVECKRDDEEAASATIAGALILNAPISEPPHIGKSRGKDVICVMAMSKMDLVSNEAFVCEAGSPIAVYRELVANAKQK